MWYNSAMDTKDIERVAVTRLRRAAAELLNRVCYGGARIIVTSSGKERAALVSIDDLEVLLSLEVKYTNRLLALERDEAE